MEPECPSASENRSANENEDAGSDDELEFGDLMRLMLADFEYWDDVMEKEPEQLQKAYSVAKEKANELRKYLTAAGMLQNTCRGKRGRFVGVSKASCLRPANRLRHSIERSLQKIFAKGRRNGAGVAEYVWAIGYVDGSIRIGSDEVLAPVWQKEGFMERVREQGNNIKITTQQFKDSLATTDLTTLLSKHLLVAERKAAITTLGRMCTPPMSLTPFGMSFSATTLSWWPSGVTYQKAWTLKGHETILVLTAMAKNIVSNYGRGANMSVEDQRKGCVEIFKSCGVGPGVSAGLKECDSKKVAILELIGEQALTVWQLPPSRVAEQEAGSSGHGGNAQGEEAPPPHPRRVRRTKEQMGTQPYPCSLCTGAYSTAAGLRNHRCKARRNPDHHAPREGVAGGNTSGEPRTEDNPPEESSPRESPTGESQQNASPPKSNRHGETPHEENEPTGSPFKTANGTGAQSFSPPVLQPETNQRRADGHQTVAAGGESDGDSDGAMDELLEEVQSQDVEGQPQDARRMHGDVQQEEIPPPIPPQLSSFLPLVYALRDKHASCPASGMIELLAKLGNLMKEEELPRDLLATLYAVDWLTYLVPKTAAYRRACKPTFELLAALHTELGVQHLRKGSNGWAAFLKECEFLDEVNNSGSEPSAPMAKAQYRLQQVRNNPALGLSLVAALPRADLANNVHSFRVEAEQALSVGQGGVAAAGEKRALSPGKETGQSERGGARVDASRPVPPGRETGQFAHGGAGADDRSAVPPEKQTGQSDSGGAGVEERSAVPHGEGTAQSDRGGAHVDERRAVSPGKRAGQSERGGTWVEKRSAVPPGEGTAQSARSGAGVDERSAVPPGKQTGQSDSGGAAVEERSAVPHGKGTGPSARGGAGVDVRRAVLPGERIGQSEDRSGAGVNEQSAGSHGEGTAQSARGGARVDERRAVSPGERTGQSDHGGEAVNERSAVPPGEGTGQSAHGGARVDERRPAPSKEGPGQSDSGGAGGTYERCALPPMEETGQTDQGGVVINDGSPVLSGKAIEQTVPGAQPGAVFEKVSVSVGEGTGKPDRGAQDGAGVDKRSAVPPGRENEHSGRGRSAGSTGEGSGQASRGVQSGAGSDKGIAGPRGNGTGQPDYGAQSGAAVDERIANPPREGTQKCKTVAGVGEKQNEYFGLTPETEVGTEVGGEGRQGEGRAPPLEKGGPGGKRSDGQPPRTRGMKRTVAGVTKGPPVASSTGNEGNALIGAEGGKAVERTRKERLRRASARAKDAKVSENDPPQPTVIFIERPPKRAASARLVDILKQVTNNKK